MGTKQSIFYEDITKKSVKLPLGRAFFRKSERTE
jgi:hypothetical protein